MSARGFEGRLDQAHVKRMVFASLVENAKIVREERARRTFKNDIHDLAESLNDFEDRAPSWSRIFLGWIRTLFSGGQEMDEGLQSAPPTVPRSNGGNPVDAVASNSNGDHPTGVTRSTQNDPVQATIEARRERDARILAKQTAQAEGLIAAPRKEEAMTRQNISKYGYWVFVGGLVVLIVAVIVWM